MNGESHRKPGPPLRPFDERSLEKLDAENVNKLGPQKSLTASIAPSKKDAKRMGIDKRTPID